MSILQICMLAVAGITVMAVIKRWNGDFLPLLRIALLLLLMGAVSAWLAPLVAYLKNLTEASGMNEHATLLFKALGIAWLTQTCADLCRESGEGGAATGVELAGRIQLLLLCLPLLDQILEITKKLLSG